MHLFWYIPPTRENPQVLSVRFFCTRVLFTVEGSVMVLLHGFIKKSQKTPASDLAAAKQRKAALERHKR